MTEINAGAAGDTTSRHDRNAGHAAHIMAAEHRGLDGTMPRPVNVTMLGAGSMFTPELAKDLFAIPGNAGGELRLVDIDRARLEPMTLLMARVVDQLGVADRWTIRATTERRDVLAGTDYIVNCIEVSGLECVRHDNDIPASFGVDQCIGDTIGPGGLFKGLRTIPVWLDVLRDAEELCPDALVLNYTNPMSMMCLAATRASSMQVVGLCHSVQATSRLLARRAGVRYRDLDWDCAGINHLAWFTRLEHAGQNLYPDVIAKAERDLAGNPDDPDDAGDLVRKDMMVHFGAFITESSGHLSEYLPYYRTRRDVIERYCDTGYDGESSFYANNWPTWRADADRNRAAMISGELPLHTRRSWEYASWIIEAREKDIAYSIHGNVANRDGLISNLPHDGIVEVDCTIDGRGIAPNHHGALPPHMAAICASNMAMYDLAAQAAIERSREMAVHALMLDPLTAAMCTPGEIKAMTLAMFEAEAEFLDDYR